MLSPVVKHKPHVFAIDGLAQGVGDLLLASRGDASCTPTPKSPMTANVNGAGACGSGWVRKRLSYLPPVCTSACSVADQSHRSPAAHSASLTKTR